MRAEHNSLQDKTIDSEIIANSLRTVNTHYCMVSMHAITIVQILEYMNLNTVKYVFQLLPLATGITPACMHARNSSGEKFMPKKNIINQ